MDYLLLWIVIVRFLVLTIFLVLMSYRGIIQRNASKILIASAFVIPVVSDLISLISIMQPALVNQFIANLANEASQEMLPEIFFVLGLIILNPKHEKHLTIVYWALVASLIPLFPTLAQYVSITAPVFGLSDVILYLYLYVWTKNSRLLVIASAIGVYGYAGMLDTMSFLFYANLLLLAGALAMFGAFFVKVNLAGERRMVISQIQKDSGTMSGYDLYLKQEEARIKKEEVETRLRRFWW
jgi:hypothetical protein